MAPGRTRTAAPLSRLWREAGWSGDGPVRVAATRRARLLGLAFLRRPPPGTALLLPRTRSVHTVGMRFALDLVWLDRAGRAVRVDRHVRPGRFRACRRAVAVLELPSSCR